MYLDWYTNTPFSRRLNTISPFFTRIVFKRFFGTWLKMIDESLKWFILAQFFDKLFLILPIIDLFVWCINIYQYILLNLLLIYLFGVLIFINTYCWIYFLIYFDGVCWIHTGWIYYCIIYCCILEIYWLNSLLNYCDDVLTS